MYATAGSSRWPRALARSCSCAGDAGGECLRLLLYQPPDQPTAQADHRDAELRGRPTERRVVPAHPKPRKQHPFTTEPRVPDRERDDEQPDVMDPADRTK